MILLVGAYLIERVEHACIVPYLLMIAGVKKEFR
jgi:hypothetical protein